MIHFVTGDAAQPQGEGPKMLVHVCNDVGAGVAGGDWNVIQPNIEEELNGLPVTVYDLS